MKTLSHWGEKKCRHKDIRKSAGKLMSVENILVSEVT